MDLFAELAPTETNVLPFELPNDSSFSYSWNECLNGFDIIIPNGRLFFSPDFFPKKVSDRTVDYFLENDKHDPEFTQWSELSSEDFEKVQFKNIQWKQDSIRLFGKSIPLPRLTSWYGDSGKGYTYSGIKSEPNAWNKGLLYIKEHIEEVANIEFNSVLLNWYRDGEDHLHWHKDDEKELGKNPVIASVNFGEKRDFMVRSAHNHKCKFTVPLTHGSLLIMSGQMQHFWEHAVPKRKKVSKSRFNLTFRVINN